jgi:hypothetical protein
LPCKKASDATAAAAAAAGLQVKNPAVDMPVGIVGW